MRPLALYPAQDVHAEVPFRRPVIGDPGLVEVVEILLGLRRRRYAVPDPRDHGSSLTIHYQTNARTSAVVTAARAIASSMGARSAIAEAATATPTALSSSTRCP